MSFRVLVAGGRSLEVYARLRDALDALLVNTRPDVEVLTPGGPGVPALAASYAQSRGLPVVTITPDFERRQGNAVEHRNALLVEAADARALALLSGSMSRRSAPWSTPRGTTVPSAWMRGDLEPPGLNA